MESSHSSNINAEFTLFFFILKLYDQWDFQKNDQMKQQLSSVFLLLSSSRTLWLHLNFFMIC